MDIFKLVGSVFVDTDKANDSLSKTDKKASSVGSTLLKGVETAGKFAVGLGAACAAGATALLGVAKSAASTTDNIDKMSQKIGISRKAYQELDFICSQSGASVDNLKAGMKTLTNQMQMASDGSKTATAVFDALGLSWTDGSGKLKEQETMMWEAFSALQSMEDQTQKAALATDLFGKAGAELMPMLNGAEGSIEAMKQQAHDLGLVLEDDAIDAGVKLTDTMDQTKRAFDSIVAKIGVRVMPIIQGALEWVLDKMPIIQNVMSVAFQTIETVVTTVGSVFQNVFSSISDKLGESGITFETVMETIKNVVSIAFNVISDVWHTIGLPVFDFIKSVVETVTTFFSERFKDVSIDIQQVFEGISGFWNEHLKPCFEAIGNFLNDVIAPAFDWVFNHYIGPVVMACFNTFKELWEKTLKPVFTNIVDFIKNVFTGNFSDAFKNLVNIVEGIWDGIVAVVKTPINAVIEIINSFIGGLNKLKIPDWVPKIGGQSISISKIPLLAEGGTVLKAGKVIVGEAGAELLDLPAGARVTPLTNGQGNALGTDEILKVLNMILAELKQLNEELYEKVLYALLNGVKINWNDRELARLVRKYA